MMSSARFLLLTPVFSLIALAQTFSSGSTGADGALNPTSNTTVQLPPSGTLNYTTVNIPAGVTLTFQNNLQNTPVIMLAQGNVTVSGIINVRGVGRAPGPGGFEGGDTYLPGFGPAHGQNSPIQVAAQWVGPRSLVAIIGGSGGAGNPFGGNNPCWGGGGGGAILIASSTGITLSGQILAYGDPLGTINCNPVLSTPGASGAVRLVANSVTVTGNLTAAIVRLEAPLGSNNYSGGGTPPIISTINPILVPTNPPSLTIVSVGGYPVPSYSGSSFNTIDLMLPTQLQDPIPVVVQATNVPVGSPVSVAFSGSASATSTTANLSGTASSSSATVYVSGLTRSAVSYLFVSASFNASQVAQNIGPASNRVSTIKVASGIGQKSTYRFLRRDGTEVDPRAISPDLRRAFGL